jgi:DNA-binding CsgD family transcriptional regulator
VLGGLVRGAAEGVAGVVLVEGPPGIGKTRLMVEARELAAGVGFRHVAARGGELEQELPFGVVRQLFESVLVEGDEGERALAGSAGAARQLFELGGEGDGPADDPSFALLHGLYWLTVNLGTDGPLLVAVDDLHWCDGASLRFLAYLVRRLEGLPVLLVLGVRSSEPKGESAVLREIASDSLTVSLRPHPLSSLAVETLIRDRLQQDPDEAFTTACHVATGGNPLLLTELLRALDAEGARPDAAHVDLVSDLGPRAVSRAVLTRLARLPPEAVEVARAVAVLGGGAGIATVAALADLEEGAARAGTAALVRAEILQAEHSLSFVHPLVGATVYQEMAPPELELRHERAAELLAAAGASDEQVAAHLLAASARGDPQIVETLRRAARVSLRKGAPESAAAYLARALEEPPPLDRRAELLVELGRAEALTSGPAAVEHLTEGYELLDDPVARGLAAQALARALLLTGRTADAAGVASRAAAELPPDLDDVRSALEAFELMTVFFGAGEPAQLRRLERYRTRPVGDGVGARMLAAIAARDWSFSGGTSTQCAELAIEALAGGDLIEADNGFVPMFAIATLVRADRPEARDAWELALEHAHRRGSLFAKCSISWGLGFTTLRWGELAEAEEAFRTAIREFALWGSGPELGSTDSVAFLAAVLRERGELAEARRTLDRAPDPGDHSDSARYWLDSQLELLVAEGRFREVPPMADDFAERFAYLHNAIDTPWRQHKALALDRLDRTDEALALAREDLQLAREWGAPGTLARSLRVLGTLERERGLDHLGEAIDVVGESPGRLEHAKALAAIGTGLRHARRPQEAREPLRRALELAEVCGAVGLVDRIRSDLYAAGGRPRTTALKGVDALTASERRVASLAAEGKTNRDIAQTLFVTPKTVEVHLSNAYRKLGIRSRRELAGELVNT